MGTNKDLATANVWDHLETDFWFNLTLFFGRSLHERRQDILILDSFVGT